MRKGVTLPTVMAILSVIISSMFVGISADMVLQPGEYIRENSVFLVSERVSASVYAMDSMERADMELELEADYELVEPQGEDLTHLKYGENSDAIDPGVQYKSETGKTDKICITKNPGSNPRVLPEGC